MNVFSWVAIFVLISAMWITWVLQYSGWAITCGIILIVYCGWLVILSQQKPTSLGGNE